MPHHLRRRRPPGRQHRRRDRPPAGRRRAAARRSRRSSPPRTCRRCARPATPASTRAPTACSTARWPAAGRIRPSWSRRPRSPPPGTTSAARCRSPARTRARAGLARRAPDPRRRAGRARPLRRRRARRSSSWSTASPTWPAYARVSYFRELYGDLAGAAEAMRAPSSPVAARARTSPTCRRCSGDLELARGRLAAARRAYDAALASVPDYVPALAGRARLTAARGDLAGAIARWRGSRRGSRCPSTRSSSARPSWRPAVRAAGRRDLALVDAQRALLAEAGVNTDVELALFEADHGDRAACRRAGARGVGGCAERALGRRARLGAHPRRPPRGRPALGAPRAAARLARPAVPLPRRHRRRRHAPRAGATCGSRCATGSTRTLCTRTAPAGAGGPMIRSLVVAVVALALLPAAASAHPLGNFSVNHLSQVSVSSDRVDVRYVLDEAEIPTFQQRATVRRRAAAAQAGRGRARLALTVDGRRVPCDRRARRRSRIRKGQGGLHDHARRAAARGARGRRHGGSSCATARSPAASAGRRSSPRPARGTAVRSSAPASDPTNGLRRYPEDLLESPSDVRSASFAVSPGAGTLDAPDGTRTGEAGDAAATTASPTCSATPRPARACCSCCC